MVQSVPQNSAAGDTRLPEFFTDSSSQLARDALEMSAIIKNMSVFCTSFMPALFTKLHK